MEPQNKATADFKSFFKENYIKFYATAYHLIEDEEIGKDIVSDAFEYIWLHKDEMKVENWPSYMHTFIRNKCIDYLRKEKVKQKYVEYYLNFSSESEEENDYDLKEERIESIQKILKTVTPQTRAILNKCYVEKQKYREVATDLGISENTVKKHIIKGLKAIREGFAKKTK